MHAWMHVRKSLQVRLRRNPDPLIAVTATVATAAQGVHPGGGRGQPPVATTKGCKDGMAWAYCLDP